MASSASDIIAKVPASFEKALEAGDLFYYPSTVSKHDELGVQFEVRLCPALMKKPHLATPHFDNSAEGWISQETSNDPFAAPYNKNLFVGEVRDDEEDEEYVVLLNKFSVVRHHFLLVTKTFQSQSSPLTPPDLVQTFKFLLAAKNAGKPIFAFYNCGDKSGASQHHKHVQFIPVENDGPPIERLARRANLEAPDKPFELSALPYANHVFRFPSYLSSTSPEELENIVTRAFLYLLDLGVSSFRLGTNDAPGKPSYNVILTTEHMHLIPRSKEVYELTETGGRLHINSLGFAGLLLVKSETELEDVKRESIASILSGVAIASVHELQSANCAHV